MGRETQGRDRRKRRTARRDQAHRPERRHRHQEQPRRLDRRAGESHEAAAKMFEGHPHFTIFPGEAVEIMEVLPIPDAVDMCAGESPKRSPSNSMATPRSPACGSRPPNAKAAYVFAHGAGAGMAHKVDGRDRERPSRTRRRNAALSTSSTWSAARSAPMRRRSHIARSAPRSTKQANSHQNCHSLPAANRSAAG